MHTALYRAYAICTYGATILAVMCALASVSDFMHKGAADVSIRYKGVDGLQREPGNDRAYVVVDVEADLRSEWTWNTKQMFVYVTVDFVTTRHPRNSVVMYSRIIQSKEEAAMVLHDLRQQYPYAVTERGYDFRGAQFNVTLSWNSMPHVGVLRTASRSAGPWNLPKDYVALQHGRVGSS